MESTRRLTEVRFAVTALGSALFVFSACGDDESGSNAGDGGGEAGERASGGDAGARATGGTASPNSGGKGGAAATQGGSPSGDAGSAGADATGGEIAGGGDTGQGGEATTSAGGSAGEGLGGASAEGGAGAAPTEGGSASEVGGSPAVAGAGGGTGDPCDGVLCESPPAAACDVEVLSTYQTPGVCSAGACDYEAIDVVCTHGCSSNGCACTPNDAVLVEGGTQFPGATSIGMDSLGGLHVAYWMDADLHYAYRPANGSWVADTLDPDAPSQVGWFPSLFIDSEDGVHIAYGVVSTGGIRYAYRASTDATFDFDVEPADSDANTGLDISMAVDDAGGVHIAHRWNGDLMYTTKPPGGSFSTHPLTPPGTANNSGTSLAIAPDGTIYIAFANAQDNISQLATKSGEPAEFEYSEIDGMSEASPELTVDPDGGLHVALWDPPLVSDMRYGYRAPGSSSWTLSPVDSAGAVGAYASIATDRFGGVHISYYDETSTALKYAYKPAGGTFSSGAVAGTLEDEDAGENTSVVVDAAGVAHISYSHLSEDALHYLRVCPAE